MIAFVRDVSPRLDRCESVRDSHAPINVERARSQHTEFAETLKQLGATVKLLGPLPENTDGVFVEGAAIVLPETVVIARPAAESRHLEIETVANALAEYRPVVRVSAPSTLDGGDVIRIGRTLFVGQSNLTNAEGAAALAETVDPFGYDVRRIEVRECRHLKTACTFIPPNFLVANPAWVDVEAFAGFTVIPVDEREPFAANTVTLAGSTLVSAAFRKTEQRLNAVGISTRRVDISEFHKAEAGLTCLCLLLESRPVRTGSATTGMKFIHADDGVRADGYFSPAIVHGGLVYVSGQLPLDAATGRAEGDVEAQTEHALRNLAGVLDVSDSGLPHLLKLTFYVTNLKMTERITAVCTRVLRGHRPTAIFVPARSLQAGCLLAIDAIAVVVDSEPGY